MFCFFFFFSSRRRHTRWNCDWSSDVCSSDLQYGVALAVLVTVGELPPARLSLAGTVGRRAGARHHTGAVVDADLVVGEGERRSEERRVGKEGRSRWLPEQYKENMLDCVLVRA